MVCITESNSCSVTLIQHLHFINATTRRAASSTRGRQAARPPLTRAPLPSVYNLIHLHHLCHDESPTRDGCAGLLMSSQQRPQYSKRVSSAEETSHIHRYLRDCMVCGNVPEQQAARPTIATPGQRDHCKHQLDCCAARARGELDCNPRVKQSVSVTGVCRSVWVPARSQRLDTRRKDAFLKSTCNGRGEPGGGPRRCVPVWGSGRRPSRLSAPTRTCAVSSACGRCETRCRRHPAARSESLEAYCNEK